MLNSTKQLCRLIYIHYVFLKCNIDALLWLSPKGARLKWLLIFLPWRWFRRIIPPTPAQIHQAFETLGPLFVKVGQLLSIRRDLLPADVADALAQLQDKVQPFASDLAIHRIEKAFKAPIDVCFKSFDRTPLGSASIAQVHAAVLPNGKEVVVKVLRPNVHQQVAQDIALLESLAAFLHWAFTDLRRFHPKSVIAEIKNTLFDELDLLKEAANASLLRRNFTDSPLMYVPEIFWDYATHDVLVMEYIRGVPINSMDIFKEKNVDLKKLAERGVEIFFTQVFRDCFFHADMHPGNVFVFIEDPDNPRYAAVDFGIMGTLSPTDQRYLAENFYAFFNRDYRKIAELHVQSGWISPNTRIEEFEASIRTVCEPIFNRPLKDISIAQTLIHLFQTAQRFNMEVQPQLILLQKTMFTIEGLGHQLYPDLDLWQTAKPFIEQWMKRQYGFKAFRRLLRSKLPILSTQLPELPEAINEISRYLQERKHFALSRPEKTQSSFYTRILGCALTSLSVVLAINLYDMNVMNMIWSTLQPIIIFSGIVIGIFYALKS